MIEETYKKLTQFQEILKKCIIDRFGSNLKPEKISLLNSTNYVIESELVNSKNGAEIQGKILRDMLRSIIDLKCFKDFLQEDGSTITITYGEDIEKEIIEFYAVNIADKYKFGIDSSSSNLPLAYELLNMFDSNFDQLMLNKNAKEILSMNEALLFTSNYENDLLSKHTSISTDINILDDTDSNIKPSVEGESNSILSDDKYKELCMKFARNESLTQQEFNMLLMSTPNLMDDSERKKIENQSANISEQEVKSRGFTFGALPTYFIILIMILLIIFGFLIL